MDLLFWIIGSILVVSAVSLVGIVTLFLGENRIKKALLLLVSFSAGALFADSFLHLLPEAFESGLAPELVSASVLAGIVVFFILEKIIHWHHHHSMEECEHTRALGITNLVGDGLHNLVDGAVIAGSYMVSLPLGIATTIAVLLHEVPQELSDFGVLLHAGFSKEQALFFNFISALGALLGAIIVVLAQGAFETIALYLVPFTAGGFVYIAGADLIPELQKEKRIPQAVAQLVFILLGMGVMFLLLFLE